jgi:pimeloyl-CoA synthetase
MNTVVRIPSKLFSHLSLEHGDKLVAVYSTLKFYKNGECKYYAYKAKNNKYVSGYALLRAKTNLSLSTLKKYVPILIDKGLCSFHSNGDFIMLGGNKVKELYNSFKMIPIKIGVKLMFTELNCLKVKLISSERQQQKEIIKKQNQSELLSQLYNPKSWALYKKAVKLNKRLQSKTKDNSYFIDKTVLSNQGYALLSCGEMNNKSKGAYIKAKLKKQGIITSTRRFSNGTKMSFEQYTVLRKNSCSNKLFYRNGMAVVELVSTFTVNDLEVVKKEETVKVAVKEIEKETVKKEIVKPLGYLSFDFVAWLANS